MKKLIIIAGPCVVENEKITMQIAEKLKMISWKYPIDLIFKASYRKANRTNVSAFIGIGDEAALKILAKVKQEFDVKVTTDIHAANEAEFAAGYVDILQIPAFLCRQTDILQAAAATGKMVNIKKGQFATVHTMSAAINKIEEIQHNYGFRPYDIMITERGNMFGYDDVVIDMRNIPLLKQLEVPVIVDVTHTNGGHYTMSYTLAKAAIAAGADGIFLETHPSPANALSDGKNMLPLDIVENFIARLIKIRNAL